MKKSILTRVCALLVCMLMIFAALPLPQAGAYTSKTVDEAMNWVHSQVGKRIGSGYCVALIQAYYEFLGVPRPTGNAYEYAINNKNHCPSGWKMLPGARPQRGDILVYNKSYYNPNGHVAIYESDNVTYHQNFNGPYVSKVTYSYNQFYDKYPGGYKLPYWGVIRPDFASASTSVSASFTTPVVNVTNNNANIAISVNKGRGIPFEAYAFTLFDKNGRKLKTLSENTQSFSNYNRVDLTINVNTEAKVSLTAGTKYQYQFTAKVKGKTFTSKKFSFTTLQSNAKFTASRSDVTSNNAQLYISLVKPRGVPLQSYTCKLYDKNGKLIKTFGEQNVGLSTYKTVNFSINVNTEMGYKLKSNTKYYYEFTAKVQGATYNSARSSFVTKR